MLLCQDLVESQGLKAKPDVFRHKCKETLVLHAMTVNKYIPRDLGMWRIYKAGRNKMIFYINTCA